MNRKDLDINQHRDSRGRFIQKLQGYPRKHYIGVRLNDIEYASVKKQAMIFKISITDVILKALQRGINGK